MDYVLPPFEFHPLTCALDPDQTLTLVTGFEYQALFLVRCFSSSNVGISSRPPSGASHSPSIISLLRTLSAFLDLLGFAGPTRLSEGASERGFQHDSERERRSAARRTAHAWSERAGTLLGQRALAGTQDCLIRLSIIIGLSLS